LSSLATGCLLAAILAAFVSTLVTYGDSWLVPWHDEVVIARLAQNLAGGKGFRNDLLDDLLTGADEKTYWQMPPYPFALSLWGKWFGFDLNSLRWLSRTLGAASLILLALIARSLGLPLWATLLAVSWTATDLTFQFSSNFVRPEALTCFLLLLTTLLLAGHLSGNIAVIASAGLIAGLAAFNHPIAFPCWLISAAIVVKRSGWRVGLVFGLPLAIFASLWLLYALQGWDIFLAQMRAHLSHKHYSPTDLFAFLMGLTAQGIRFYIGVPLNGMPWLSPLVVTAYVGLREKWVVPRWFVAFAAVLYVSAMLGAEAWYPSLFVPFGYLMLAAFVDHLVQKATKLGRFAILVAPLLWWSYQASVVFRHLLSVPQIRSQVANFISDLERSLPEGAKVLVGSFSPDPTFALMARRPDIKVYALMPQPMVNAEAMKRLRSQLTHLVVLEEAASDPLLTGKELKRWQFDFGGLSRGERVTVLLLSVNEGRHNSALGKSR